MSFLLQREQLLRPSGCLLALLWLTVACSALILWGNPLAPLLLIVGACGASIGLLLLPQPLAALYIALFLRVLPSGLWPLALDTVNTVVVNAAVALALGAWLLDVGAQRRPITWSPVCLLIALYILWATMTLLWAPDLIEAKKSLVTYISGFILLLLISNQVTSLRSVDGVMRVLCLIGWTTILCGLYALLFTDFQLGHRLKVLNMNENELGVVLILMVPSAIWPVLRSSGVMRGLHFALCILFILFTIALVVLSGSRGSALSLAVVLVSLLFCRSVRPWALLVSVLVAGLLASAPGLLDSLSNRLAQQEGGELGGRNVIWQASLLMFRDLPWTGAGIGNGPRALHKYIAMLTNHYNYRDDLPSHNPLLETALETGVVGTLVYASVVVCAIWQFFSSWVRSPMRDGAQTAYFPLLFAIAAGYLVSWMKSGGLGSHPTLFVLLALLTIPSRLPYTANDARRGRREQSCLGKPDRFAPDAKI